MYKFPAISRNGCLDYYLNRTNGEKAADPYERYYEVVLPSAIHHLHPSLRNSPPYGQINEYTIESLSSIQPATLLDLGCGIGYTTAMLSYAFPEAEVLGLDLSEQMLKFAAAYWKERKGITLDWSTRGFSKVKIRSDADFPNLHFLLANTMDTPFMPGVFDAVTSHFLWDRISDPEKWIAEIHRILKQEGLFIMTTPLNYLQGTHWNTFYPFEKAIAFLQANGFRTIKTKENINVKLPLDIHGNGVQYKVKAWTGVKI